MGYVISYPGISEMKSFKKDKLIANTYEIVVRNTDNAFSVQYPNSIFGGTNWLYASIKVKGRSGELEWDGVVTSIYRDHVTKTARIRTKNVFYKFRNEIITYQSSTWETGAKVWENVCNDIGYTNYDNPSLQQSNTVLSNNSKMMVDVKQEDNITFHQLTEKLGEYCNADVYSHKNDIYFVHWVLNTNTNLIHLGEDDFRNVPTVYEDEKEIINDYSIGYYGDADVPATDANSNNIGVNSRNLFGIKSLPELRSNDGNQIVFENKAAAIYIGEGNIKRTVSNYNKIPNPLTKINFSLYNEDRYYMTLNTKLSITFSDEGWTNKIFEVFQFTIDEDNDEIVVVAYEVV